MMGIVSVFVLLIIAVSLYYFIRSGRIPRQTAELIAQVVGIVAGVAAIAVFIVPTGSTSSTSNEVNTASTNISLPAQETSEAVITSTVINDAPITAEIEIDLLPTIRDVPGKLRIINEGTLSNEQATSGYSRPVELLKQFEHWGRITSIYRVFASEEQCNQQLGIVYIDARLAKYKTVAGAESAFDADILATFSSSDSVISPKRSDSTVGEQAWTRTQMIWDNCSPPNTLRGVILSFRRANIIGTVQVLSQGGTSSDEKIIGIAQEIARKLDLRISNTK